MNPPPGWLIAFPKVVALCMSALACVAQDKLGAIWFLCAAIYLQAEEKRHP